MPGSREAVEGNNAAEGRRSYLYRCNLTKRRPTYDVGTDATHIHEEGQMSDCQTMEQTAQMCRLHSESDSA